MMTHAMIRRLITAYAAFFVWGALSAAHFSTRANAAEYPSSPAHAAFER